MRNELTDEVLGGRLDPYGAAEVLADRLLAPRPRMRSPTTFTARSVLETKGRGAAAMDVTLRRRLLAPRLRNISNARSVSVEKPVVARPGRWHRLDMKIVRLDRSDDDLVKQVWEVAERSTRASRVQPRRTSLVECAADLRFVQQGEHDEMVVAIVEDRVVGGAQVWFSERDNTDKCWFTVFVDPLSRRRGVGSALVHRIEETVRAEQRALALAEVFVPVGERVEHPGARFATSHGYTVSDIEIVRRLSLPIDPSRLDALQQGVTRKHGRDYVVAVYRGGAPEALQQGVCDISNRLVVDAPTGDLNFEAESTTPADYQNYLDHESSIGRERLTAIALERTTGEVVAYSDLVLPQGDPAAVIQWGTFVAQEHRGHRLGLAVKTANLGELTRIDPGRRHIETMNAEDNPWMVQINVDLGFEVIEEALMLRKDL